MKTCIHTALHGNKFETTALWKPWGQVITETAKKMATSASSEHYKRGFGQKMTKQEAGLILGISPTIRKTKVQDAHSRVMLLNHPDKGCSPYLAAKINKTKDLVGLCVTIVA
ncbi:dnaJ homolog subfamily C member 15-like [Anguilla rostrata]|uniref:dnaJ homolog subfamily C member 15-like n=1 Tax=Anguilla rostrata TaxID=7938 RepID=UPI0030CED5CB